MKPGTRIKIESFLNKQKDKFSKLKSSLTKKSVIYTSIIAIFILLIIVIFVIYRNVSSNKSNIPSDYAEYNRSTIFEVNNIYMYSSADATSNNTNKALWNLNLHQFTDISISLKISPTKNTSESSIKKLYITNVKISDSIKGNPNLYYKDIREFGKLSKNDDNKIDNRLDYEILDPESQIDYSKPQFKSDASMPITLTYINNDFKENAIVADISEPLTYDGSLLKKSTTLLTDLKGTVSFTLNIINNQDTKFICDLELPIELENDSSTIYDGNYVQQINDKKAFYKTN